MRAWQSSLVILLFALIGIFALPAKADDAADCGKAEGNDPTIAACTRRIESGKLKGRDLALAYSNRGYAWGVKNNLDRAFADFDAAIRIDPKSAVAYEYRGSFRRNSGDNDRAMADFDQSVRLDPSRGVVYFGRAIVWENKGDIDRAIADYTESIRRPPAPMNAFANRGVLLTNKGEFDRAIADLNEALRRDTGSFDYFTLRGDAFAGKGDLDRAIADYTDAISLQPKAVGALLGRGLVYERMGRLEQAAADLRAVLQIDPQHSVAKGGLSRVESKIAALGAAKPAAVPQSQTVITTLPALAGRRVALVIGNGDYQYANKLANPANDAADVAQALRKLGFDVVEGRDLDKRGIEDKLREFSRKLGGAKLALFFYAGHGMQVAGKNYLIPVDARLEQPGDLRLDTIDITDVLTQMEAEQRVNLVFLDACRDNPLSRSFARSMGSRSTSVGQGLAMVQSAVGTMIAYATQPDAVALDGAGRNSPFTTALLKHIGTPSVDIGTVMRRVRADVIAATSERQVPWDHSSLVGDVVLVQ